MYVTMIPFSATWKGPFVYGWEDEAQKRLAVSDTVGREKILWLYKCFAATGERRTATVPVKESLYILRSRRASTTWEQENHDLLIMWFLTRCQGILRRQLTLRLLMSCTGCNRRKGQNFGRVFLMLKYTDITQNTYIQSWTVTEIMAREKCVLLVGPRTVPVSCQVLSMFVLESGVLWQKVRSH